MYACGFSVRSRPLGVLGVLEWPAGNFAFDHSWVGSPAFGLRRRSRARVEQMIRKLAVNESLSGSRPPYSAPTCILALIA